MQYVVVIHPLKNSSDITSLYYLFAGFTSQRTGITSAPEGAAAGEEKKKHSKVQSTKYTHSLNASQNKSPVLFTHAHYELLHIFGIYNSQYNNSKQHNIKINENI